MGLLPMQGPIGNDAPLTAAEGNPLPAEGGDMPKNISDERGPSPMDEETNVSPEEQELYDTFVKKGADLIYTDAGKINDAVLDALHVDTEDLDERQGSARIMALAHTGMQIVKKLDESAREQGQDIPDDILAHGGKEIIEELGEIASKAGIYDYSEEELSGAYFQAVDMYRDEAIKSGRTSEETLKGQFAEIDEADKAGKLGDVLPGFDGSTLGTPPVQPQE